MVNEHPAKELLYAIGDGKQIECSMNTELDWRNCTEDFALVLIGNGHAKYLRIARPMVERTVRYPEPLRVKPERGVKYWYFGAEYVKPCQLTWLNDGADNRIFAAGMAFATEADAAEAHRALFGAQT